MSIRNARFAVAAVLMGVIFDYLAALPDVGPDRIIVHGQSLGSFAAGHRRFLAAVTPLP